MPTNKALDYVDAIVMGNGGNTAPTAQLQFTVMTTYSFTFCKKMLSHVIDWSDAYICAYGKQSALKGDSGAPFVRDNTIIGVLSFGAKGKVLSQKNVRNKHFIKLKFLLNNRSAEKSEKSQKFTIRLFKRVFSFGMD